MSYRTRKVLALIVLLIGLPVYVVAATSLVGMFERPGRGFELVIYVGLGLLWALPLKWLFKGLARSDPDRPEDPQ